MEYFATVADKRFILDWNELPQQSQERIIRYGVQRIINDRCGGKDKPKEDKHAIAQEMLDALKSGEFKTRGSGGVDPVLVETRKLALKAWLAKDKDRELPDDKDAKNELADKIIAAVPDDVRDKLTAMGKAEHERKVAERDAKRKAADKVASAMGDIDI